MLRRVRIPLPGGRELRKVLFDRADLDALVERWKAAPVMTRDPVGERAP